MMKFEKGTWVRKNGKIGKVTGHKQRSCLVRFVGSTKAIPCGSVGLKKCLPPRALVFEGSLDIQLHSTRSEEDLLRTWFNANKIELAYKNVHSLVDIKILSASIGKDNPLFVHISCHGAHQDKKAYIRFAPKGSKKNNIFLNDPKTVKVFHDSFSKLPILFSACDLGRYEGEMNKFIKSTKIPYIAAFTREVYDTEAMIFELLLYHGIYNNLWTFETAIKKAMKSLLSMNVRGGKGKGKSLVKIFKP